MPILPVYGKTAVVRRQLITLKRIPVGKGVVNNCYCNNGALIGAELVLQIVMRDKAIHWFPTFPSISNCENQRLVPIVCNDHS